MAKKAKSKKAKKRAKKARQTVHEIYLAGLGALASVGEGGAKLAHGAIERGKKLATTGKNKGSKRVRDAEARMEAGAEAGVEAFGGWVDERVQGTLERLGVPSRADLQALNARFETLIEKVSGLETVADSKPEAGKDKAGTSAGGESVTVFEVAKHDDGWHVTAAGRKTPIAVASTKKAAMARARDEAKASEPSEIVARRVDGTVQDRYGYGTS